MCSSSSNPLLPGGLIPVERRHTDGVGVRQAEHETQRNGRLVQFGAELERSGGERPLGRHAGGDEPPLGVGDAMARAGGFLI